MIEHMRKDSKNKYYQIYGFIRHTKGFVRQRKVKIQIYLSQIDYFKILVFFFLKFEVGLCNVMIDI